MSFPTQVKEDALVACGRHCCLCHRFCGLKIELHHIQHSSKGGSDTFDNCLPVCLDCHADMRSYDHRHPKGTKYSEAELRRHRDEWYAKVKASPGSSYPASSREQDTVAFNWLVEQLPYAGVVDYIERQNFGAPFKLSKLEPLEAFLSKSENPFYEFIDADLEGLRGALCTAIEEFMGYMSHHTWPMQNSDLQAIPREWEDQRYSETITHFNDLRRELVAAYRGLVLEARRRLGV